MSKQTCILDLLAGKNKQPVRSVGSAFAPTNIALVKYWGKRDQELNLPLTNSLSISVGDKGAVTSVSVHDGEEDLVRLNQHKVNQDSHFYIRLKKYLDLFRKHTHSFYKIETQINIPVAAGLASSACGFAALVKALNDLYGWDLSLQELSLLARMGSGSAARSLWDGFVEWEKGAREDGLDSFGKPLNVDWPELKVGFVILTEQEKYLSSRMAMKQTVETSPFMPLWPEKVAQDLHNMKTALKNKDFALLGHTAESNAQCMHALMMSATPSIEYSLPETLKAKRAVWRAREQGVEVYFTQDAGPNLKLLFLEKESDKVQSLAYWR